MTSEPRTRARLRLTLPTAPVALHTQPPNGGALRHPLPQEAQALAELMLDAYRGTIDDEGETGDDALAEVEGFFAGRAETPLLDSSWVYHDNGTLLSACLITRVDGEPLVAYLMTRSAWKGRGLASYLPWQHARFLHEGRPGPSRWPTSAGDAAVVDPRFWTASDRRSSARARVYRLRIVPGGLPRMRATSSCEKPSQWTRRMISRSMASIDASAACSASCGSFG